MISLLHCRGNFNERFDYHIHSLYSDGQSTLEDCAREAERKNLSEIAFADHVWRSSDWIGRYVEEIEALRVCVPKLRILAGAEAKVINFKSKVDIHPEEVQRLDFLMGAVHGRLPDESNEKYRDLTSLSPEDVVLVERDLIAALVENPQVDVIAHPMRLFYKFYYLRKTEATYPLSVLYEILRLVKDAGKLIELNFKVPNLRDVVEAYRQSGVSFTLGSDAHSYEDVGNIPYERIKLLCRNEQQLS